MPTDLILYPAQRHPGSNPLPGLIIIRSQLGLCLEASNLAHLPMPVARTSSEASACLIGCQSFATCSPRCPTCPVAICIYPEVNLDRRGDWQMRECAGGQFDAHDPRGSVGHGASVHVVSRRPIPPLPHPHVLRHMVNPAIAAKT